LTVACSGSAAAARRDS